MLHLTSRDPDAQQPDALHPLRLSHTQGFHGAPGPHQADMDEVHVSELLDIEPLIYRTE